MHGASENSHLPRLLILCAGDPDNERTFSGSARSLFVISMVAASGPVQKSVATSSREG